MTYGPDPYDPTNVTPQQRWLAVAICLGLMIGGWLWWGMV